MNHKITIQRCRFGVLMIWIVVLMVHLPVVFGDRNVVGMQGQDITLVCNATLPSTNGTVVWQKDGKLVDIKDQRYTVWNKTRIKISDLLESDSGTYRCLEAGKAIETVKLIIQSKPEFTDLFKAQTVMAGSPLTLKCVSVGFPKPLTRWFKDGKAITSSTRIELQSASEGSFNSVSSQLIVKEVTLKDAGLYQCLSGNAYGHTSHEAQVQVYNGVSFVTRPEDGVTGIQSKFTFDCIAKSNPLPRLVWLKGSTVITNNTWFHVETKTRHEAFIVESTLSVKDARREDSGTYKCLAVNNFGRKTAEAKLSVLEKPDPVTLKVKEVGPRSIEVEWTAGFNGNVRITAYVISYNSTIFLSSKTTEETRIRLEKLEPETKYRIGVAATNVIGTSKIAVVYATTAVEYVPSVLAINVSEVTSSTLKVGWTRRANKHIDGKRYGLEILVYDDDMLVKNTTTYQVESHGFYTMSGLDPYTQYSVTVREVYAVIFTGPYTNRVNVTTAEDAPGRPRNVSALGISKTAVLLLWNPPEPLNGIIREYEIRYSHLDDTNAMAVVTRQKNILTKDHKDRRIVLDNLTAFTRYHIHVRERTLLNHWGPRSDVTVMTLEDVPSKPPKNTKYTMLNDTAFMLSWKAIPANEVRGILTGYKVYSDVKRSGTLKQYTLDASKTDVVLANLIPFTVYRNKIVGMTNAGVGPGVSVNFKTPEGVPSKPTSITTNSRSGDTIVLEWKGPTFENGVILRYQVLWKKLGFIRARRSVQDDDEVTIEKVFTPGKQRSETIQKLEPFTMYRFRVREATSKGWGPFSLFVNGSTIESKPSKPLFLKTTEITDSTITITWKQPKKPNGIIQYYLIFCWDGINLVQDFKVHKPTNHSKDTFLASIKRLESGKTYAIEVRAVNTFMGKAEQVSILTTQSGKTSNKELFPWLPLIAGVVGGIILIALITATALLCTRKKKYSEIDGNHDDTPMNGFIKNRPIHVAHLKHYVQQNHANSDHGFYTEYESIKVPISTFTWENSQQPCNQQKNRYSNIVAYDHSRVVLSNIENSAGSTYINASFIDGYKSPRKFIATQGPLPHTISDFWRMVWEQKSHVVIMLTKLVEDSRVKCEQYWPDQGTATYKNLMLTATGRTEMTDYMMRTFVLNNIAEPHQGKREIVHYHFTAWPDHGVPEHPTSMVMFIRHVMGSIPTKPGPIIAHCSAGVGRTGTFIVIDAMLHQIKEESVVDVFGFVSHIRRQRNFMVQTEAQYIFIYDALLDAVICGNTEIAAQDLLSKLRYLNQQDPDTGETYLRDEFKRLEAGPGPTEKIQFVVASHSDNKMKNRFLNILPYDRNRVRLAQIVGFRGSDYINASYIDGFQKRRAFVATQAPLANTLNDFWRMVWEQNCHCIVMLTKLSEKGQERCHQYWPPFGTEMYGKIMVDNLAEKDHGEFISREFHVTHTESGKSRKVRHFMFLSWPQHGSPSTGAGMIQLIGDVQRSQLASGNGPIVVHCSGGVGRTGAFTALCNCIERLKVEGIIDLFQTVRQLRTQRPAMVQTIDQYYFCYQALKDYLDSFDLYSNFA